MLQLSEEAKLLVPAPLVAVSVTVAAKTDGEQKSDRPATANPRLAARNFAKERFLEGMSRGTGWKQRWLEFDFKGG